MSIKYYMNLQTALVSSSVAQATFGTPIILDEHTVTSNRQDGPYSSAAAAIADGFTTALVPDIHAWITALTSQLPHVSQFYIGRRAAAEAADDAMDAVEAAGPASWYFTATTTRDDTDAADLAAWHETRAKQCVLQTSSAAMLAGTGGNIGETLSGLGYNRTSLWYHASDSEALDGAIMGRCGAFALDQPRGSGSWAWHELAGITNDALTDANLTQLKAYNCNYYSGFSYTSQVAESGKSFPGNAVSGRSIKAQTTLDFTQARLEEALTSVFIRVAKSTTPSVLFDDRGIGMLQAAANGVLRQLVIGGHILGDVVSADTGLLTPYIKFPRPSEISATDKQLGRLTGITGEMVIASAIRTIGDENTVGLTADLKFA